MRVYLVVGNNRESYEDYRVWNEAVFTSEELAKNYISERMKRYARDYARMDELYELKYIHGGLTVNEEEELQKLKERWRHAWDGCPDYVVEEYELREYETEFIFGEV